MLTLAVDTSTRAGSVAVLRDEKVLDQLADNSSEPYSVRLIGSVDALLGRSRISLGEFDLFAVAAGPGSFTGLRVGLTAVKVWAEVFGRSIAPVSALECIAAQVNLPAASRPISLLAPVLDARRGQVFGAVYRYGGEDPGHLQLLDEEMVTGAREFLEFVKEKADGARPIFASPSPEVMDAALLHSCFEGSPVERVSPVLAPVIGRLGYRQALCGEVVDALRLDANYIRRSDAELNWKGE